MACSPPFPESGFAGWGWSDGNRRKKPYRTTSSCLPSLRLSCLLRSRSHFGRESSKSQAGDRRLLIWNITTQAIMEHPVTGIGIGGFPATYAKEQSAYFETDTASSKEKQTATCPQYAYNEYLQIGLELGITGLLFFIFWLSHFPLLWDQTQTDWSIRRNSGTRNLRPLFLSAPTPDLLGSALIPDRHMCDQSEA